MGDLQKANMWKRISAALFDWIMLAIIAVGMAFFLSVVFNYNAQYDALQGHMARYEEKYGVEFDNLYSTEAMEKLTEAEKATLMEAQEACNKDPEVMRLNTLMYNMTLLIVTFALLIAYVIMELIVPLVLRNGQTFGKKLFGLAVIREDGIRVTPFLMTVRTVLGKYTVEAMVPLYILIMIVFNMTGIVGAGVLFILLVGQIVIIAANRNRPLFHDLFARTVVVDYASQRIFDSVEERDEYYRRLHEERAARADY